MRPIDQLVIPTYLVPIEPRGQVLEGHAMAIDHGRILELLPLELARQRYAPTEILELPGHAVMPGLVNAHTHSAMSLLRGIADDLGLMDWLHNHVWPAESRHVDAAFCADGVRLAAAEMIRCGQTCFNDMYFFPEVTAEVAAEAGLRVCIGLIVFDFSTPWAQTGEYIHKGLALHDQLRGRPLIHTVFAPHAPYTVSDAPLLELRKYATELGIGIHMHVHETAQEVIDALASDGRRPWQRLMDLELLGPDFIAVHMTQMTDLEIEQAAAFGVHIAHCPESNLKLASGFCPVGKLLAAGVNVALGTDGAASNNDLDLFGEMRTAALLAKGVSGDPRTLPAAQALEMATLSGARALGLEQEIGSLRAGKSADYIAVNLTGLQANPLYNVLSQLVYAVHGANVTHVCVAGRPLLVNSRLVTLDEAAILSDTSRWRDRIISA